jgi:hypothetical protein
MSTKRDRGDELAADSVQTLRHVKRLQVQVERDLSEKRLTPKELGYEHVRARAVVVRILCVDCLCCRCSKWPR